MTCTSWTSFGYFNPRSREGSDLSVASLSWQVYISIHAPAKGATFSHSFIDRLHRFQSTLPRRERLLGVLLSGGMTEFQSTLPRRERPLLPDTRYPYQNFNPRSREGSDKGFQDTLKMIELFQSTLPRRERLSRLANALGVNVFQSTLPRRERPSCRAVPD